MPDDPPAEKRGFFARMKAALARSTAAVTDTLRAGVAKTRAALGSVLTRMVGRPLDQELQDELYDALIKADVGPALADELIEALCKHFQREPIQSAAAVTDFLKEYLTRELVSRPTALTTVAQGPLVILVVGVNGSGKTTSIAKLAWYFREQGAKVVLAAGDTFRAAAVAQLRTWAERVGAIFVTKGQDADPAAVAYEGCERALAEGADVLIVDTAGRLHTNKNLMHQLEKIHAVLGRKVPGAPHETLLVLDATTGQNALEQARQFKAATNVSGLFLAKLDGTAKGGAVLAIHREVEVPVKFVGLGESMDAIEPFNPARFVEALFALDEEPPSPGAGGRSRNSEVGSRK